MRESSWLQARSARSRARTRRTRIDEERRVCRAMEAKATFRKPLRQVSRGAERPLRAAFGRLGRHIADVQHGRVGRVGRLGADGNFRSAAAPEGGGESVLIPGLWGARRPIAHYSR